MKRRGWRFAIPLALGIAGCTTVNGGKRGGTTCPCEARPADLGRDAPRARASATFWKRWGDGKAELSGYRVTVMRYGKPRAGTVVLIYVTETLDRNTLIKDDGPLPAARRLPVLKLNRMTKFLTGIYPYSVMTSVFSPVDAWFGERFTPVKVALSSQEWCGHVWHQIRPEPRRVWSHLRSYFKEEGERDEALAVPPGTLYEDALFIQLRELDGPFNGGRDWSGTLMPSLWSVRKRHRPLAGVAATIRRSDARRGEVAVTRFTVERGAHRLVIDVEKAAPRRILGWRTSDGERGEILKTARLAYWRLNGPEGVAYRKQLGLSN